MEYGSNEQSYHLMVSDCRFNGSYRRDPMVCDYCWLWAAYYLLIVTNWKDRRSFCELFVVYKVLSLKNKIMTVSVMWRWQMLFPALSAKVVFYYGEYSWKNLCIRYKIKCCLTWWFLIEDKLLRRASDELSTINKEIMQLAVLS